MNYLISDIMWLIHSYRRVTNLTIIPWMQCWVYPLISLSNDVLDWSEESDPNKLRKDLAQSNISDWIQINSSICTFWSFHFANVCFNIVQMITFPVQVWISVIFWKFFIMQPLRASAVDSLRISVYGNNIYLMGKREEPSTRTSLRRMWGGWLLGVLWR